MTFATMEPLLQWALSLWLIVGFALTADVEYILLIEKDQPSQLSLVQSFTDGMSQFQQQNGQLTFNVKKVEYDRDFEEESLTSFCDVAEGQSFTAVLDMTWGGWSEVEKTAKNNGAVYIRLDTTNHHLVKVSLD